MYLLDSIPGKIDVRYSCPDIELLWIRLSLQKKGPGLLAGCLYRPPSADGGFRTQIAAALEGAEGEEIVLLGDLNGNFLQPSSALFSHLKQAVLLPLQLSNLIMTNAVLKERSDQLGCGFEQF